MFTFFGPDNWEFMVKLLDGCAINQNFWVLASAATDVAYELKVTDRATGAIKTYGHAAGSPASPIFDLQAFASCQAPRPPAAYPPALPIPPLVGRCGIRTSVRLCSGRRRPLQATVSGPRRIPPAPRIRSPTAASSPAFFTFFSTTNWELLVKVLDGCALNGRHWVYAAGTTDVGWRLEIEDLVTHETKIYENPLGQPSRTITDSDALGGCPLVPRRHRCTRSASLWPCLPPGDAPRHLRPPRRLSWSAISRPASISPGPRRAASRSFGSMPMMAAEDPVHGQEPWIWGGAPAGLRRLADLLPGPAGSNPRLFTEVERQRWPSWPTTATAT